jgi:uncharacterized protein YbaR (Trm112 family)
MTSSRQRWPTALPGCPECDHNRSGLYTDEAPGGYGLICHKCGETYPAEEGIEGVV